MSSETLDVIIEGRGRDTWLLLSGPFTQDQIPHIREKVQSLIDDRNRSFIVDLEQITVIDSGVVLLFLQLLNTLKSKGGELKFVFKNDVVTKTFSPYSNSFAIYPDVESFGRGGLLAQLRRQSKFLTRKTGIRLSRPIALFLLTVLCGWFLSLVFIIHLQNRHIKKQQTELHDLTQWKTSSTLEIEKLQSRIRPLEQLGILRDTAESR